MRFAIAAVLAAHGIAHLVGFVSSWRIAELAELPYKTTIVGGRLDVGDVGARLVGLLWLIAALMFIAAAAGVAMQAQWAARLTAFVVAVSLALCVAGWPDARLGVPVNLALVALLLVNARWALVGNP